MQSRRYTIVVADRSSGVVRRFTVALRPALVALACLFALPVLIGLGARWSALDQIGNLEAAKTGLELENASFRQATAAAAEASDSPGIIAALVFGFIVLIFANFAALGAAAGQTNALTGFLADMFAS